MSHERFPRQHARTRGFTLGRPRSFTVAPDGERVLFLRSATGGDPVTGLWCLDVATGRERPLADPRELGHDPDRSLPAPERARRERLRERAGGITAYTTDRAVSAAAFVLAGRLYVVDVADGTVAEQPAADGPYDPRLSPDGTRLAHVADDGLHVAERGGRPHRLVAHRGAVRWGVAEFVAAEEMGRTRGYWWAPDGDRLAVCRVDEEPVGRWHLGDPADPATEPAVHRYPAAGTDNAEVGLAVVDLDGAAIPVDWPRAALPYLARVVWSPGAPLTALAQSRDQRRWEVRTVDPDTGDTRLVRADEDAAWLDLVPGAPAWLDGQRLVMVHATDRGPGGTHSVTVDGDPVTPPGLQVDGIVDVTGTTVWFTGRRDPTVRHLHRLDVDGGQLEAVTTGAAVTAGAARGDTAVVATAPLEGPPDVHVHPAGTSVASHAPAPVVTPEPELLELGDRRLRATLLRPRRGPAAARTARLPVLLAPYGGPHAQRAVARRDAYLTGQWLADLGMAVLIVDGRGTPGRGPAWERAVGGDLAGPVLADQVDALRAAADHEPRLDLDRVAIRGWSFGGYLAALAVLRRPEVFHAGIAGAPVTDWRLYDTHYTERYLGHPDRDQDAYRNSSLVDADGRLLGAVSPPGDDAPELLIIHGLADDNVVAAHSLRLSAALLADGRPHRFLPLSGVTHFTSEEVVAEHLLELQAQFLRSSLGLDGG